MFKIMTKPAAPILTFPPQKFKTPSEPQVDTIHIPNSIAAC